MAEFITQRELRNDSGEIMRRLDQGESFVITCNGHRPSSLQRPHALLACQLYTRNPDDFQALVEVVAV